MDVVVRTREFASEGNDAGDGLGVGAAADDFRLVLVVAGDFAVGGDQLGDQVGIRREEERITTAHQLDRAFVLVQMAGTQHAQLLRRIGNREAAVQRREDLAVLHADDAVVQGQRAVFILDLQTDAGAVVGGADMMVVEHDEIIHEAGGGQSQHGIAGGIDAELRGTGVRGDTLRLDDELAVIFGHAVADQRRHGETLLQRFFRHTFRGNDGAAFVADRVEDEAALDVQDSRILAVRDHAEHAFFTIDAGEITVGCETAGDGFLVLPIICHAPRTGLLVAAHQQADALVQWDPAVAHGLHRVQGRDHSAFIITDAAAVDPVALAGQGERIRIPTVARGHDVQVRRDADDLRAFAHFGITTVVIQILGGKAHLIGDLQRFREAGSRPFTERLALGSFTTLGIILYQTSKLV